MKSYKLCDNSGEDPTCIDSLNIFQLDFSEKTHCSIWGGCGC